MNYILIPFPLNVTCDRLLLLTIFSDNKSAGVTGGFLHLRFLHLTVDPVLGRGCECRGLTSAYQKRLPLGVNSNSTNQKKYVLSVDLKKNCLTI